MAKSSMSNLHFNNHLFCGYKFKRDESFIILCFCISVPYLVSLILLTIITTSFYMLPWDPILHFLQVSNLVVFNTMRFCSVTWYIFVQSHDTFVFCHMIHLLLSHDTFATVTWWISCCHMMSLCSVTWYICFLSHDTFAIVTWYICYCHMMN